MRNKNILVVEDDADIRNILCVLLRDEGYTTVGAPDGRAALEYLLSEEKKPDLILLDLMMPVMSGYELLEEMKTAGISIPVVIVSAVTETAVDLGALPHIKKPFELGSLLATIRRQIS